MLLDTHKALFAPAHRLRLLVDNGMPRVRTPARRLLAAARKAHSGPALHAAFAVPAGLLDRSVPRARHHHIPHILATSTDGERMRRRLHAANIHLLRHLQRVQFYRVLFAQYRVLIGHSYQVSA